MLKPQSILLEPVPVTLLVLQIRLTPLPLQYLLTLLLDLLPVVPSLAVLTISLLLKLMLLLTTELLAPLVPNVLRIAITALSRPRTAVLLGPYRIVLVTLSILLLLYDPTFLLLALLRASDGVGLLSVIRATLRSYASLLVFLLLLDLSVLTITSDLFDTLLLYTLAFGVSLLYFGCTLLPSLPIFLCGLPGGLLPLLALLLLLLDLTASIFSTTSDRLRLLCLRLLNHRLSLIRLRSFRSPFILPPTFSLGACITEKE